MPNIWGPAWDYETPSPVVSRGRKKINGVNDLKGLAASRKITATLTTITRAFRLMNDGVLAALPSTHYPLLSTLTVIAYSKVT